MARIDSLAPGSLVRLSVDGSDPEDAVFICMLGEGDEREARFAQVADGTRRLFTWEAYRSEGRWVCGSPGLRLSVLEVVEEFSLMAAFED